MAAPTVTLDAPIPGRLGNTGMGVIGGVVSADVYDNTHPAVTAITGHFLSSGPLRVVPDGVTTSGYAVSWDTATTSFKVYQGGTAVSLPLVEVANGTTAGSFGFIAVGRIGG